MQVKKAVADIKAAGHDISDEYSVEECLGFLNTAINEVSSLLIAARSPMIVSHVAPFFKKSVVFPVAPASVPPSHLESAPLRPR